MCGAGSWIGQGETIWWEVCWWERNGLPREGDDGGKVILREGKDDGKVMVAGR